MRSLSCVSLYTIVFFGSTVSGTLIGNHMNECEMKGLQLTCDFENLPVALTLEDTIDDTTGRSSFLFANISNAKSVSVIKPSCVSMAFHNVPMVTISDRVTCAKRRTNFALTNGVANRIPGQKLTSLKLKESTVGLLKSELITFFEIKQSTISEFIIQTPLTFTTCRIDNSYIEKLTEIKVFRKTTLLISNTTIGSMDSRSIILGGHSTLKLINVTIKNSATDSIIAKEGSTIQTENVSGSINIISESADENDIDGRTAPGVPPKKVPSTSDDPDLVPIETDVDKSCRRSNSKSWIPPTAVAVIEAIIILLLLYKSSGTNTASKFPNKDSETGYDSPNIFVDHQRQSTPMNYYHIGNVRGLTRRR